MKPTAEIVTIGNEILIGHTLDTNSNWIAKRLRHYGWQLSRVTTIPDSLSEIQSTVRNAIARRPVLLFTLGGLGPTPDDMTMKGVARALEAQIIVNGEALRMVREYYRKMEGETAITHARRKMATLPEGALPLKNPIGTAPGVSIERGGTRLVSLPGVPREMKAIFERSIVPILKEEGSGAPIETTLRITGVIESALAPIIVAARQEYHGLYFKSHPRGGETRHPLILLHVYSVEEEGRSKVREAAAYVLKRLAALRPVASDR